MYVVPIEVRLSDIDGQGVFALQNIAQGRVVWQFVPAHDKSMTPNERAKLSEEQRTALDRIAYLSTESHTYIFPPDEDPARYTNHSENNNLSVRIDKQISPEPFFFANRDIIKGEELTNNYKEFDSKAAPLEWLNK